MNTLLDDLKKYYANLLIVQYHNKPKAIATIKMLVKLMWANMALMQIRDAFDWKTASEVQLEIIGIWVGVDRSISTSLFDGHSWFSLINIPDVALEDYEGDEYQGGFAEISNFDTVEGGFLTDNLTVHNKVDLPVNQFRFLVGLKIIKNNIDHCCKSIDDAIYYFSEYLKTTGDFEGCSIKTQWDLTNRKLIYKYSGNIGEILEVAELKGCLPCPPTCTIKLEEI